MEEILCNISAFQLLRTPPQALALCPPVPPLYADKARAKLRRHFLYTDILRSPVHIQIESHNRHSRSACIKTHLRTETPAKNGGIVETESGLVYTTPLPTLLSLAQTLNEDQLMMAMYELCGAFSVFEPTPQTEAFLANAYATGELRRSDGWRRVNGTDGSKSSLWMREPLITIDQLVSYAKTTTGMRGHKKFLRAAQSITGICASPFEVQVSMLLSLSRRRGGEGIAALSNNQEILFEKDARLLTGKGCAYGDILIDRGPNRLPLILECQGKLVHNGLEATLSDSDRTTALQSMGYDVLLLTHQQISHSEHFKAICRLISEKTGIPVKPKTALQKAREDELRFNLFGSWDKLSR